MKIAILSCGPKCYSTRRLREAGESRGHKVKVLNTLKFAIDLKKGDPDLYFRQKQLSDYDVVIPRIGASITHFGTAVVRQFEQMQTFTVNSSTGILNSRDKLRSLQILSRHHVGIPETTYVRDKKDVLPAIERVGGAPVIIKLLEGTQGIGVLLADTVESASALIELLQSQKQNVLIQKFVSESKGKDIRAFVVGDQVVASMRRVAQGQEFRSNVHRGGVATPVALDENYRKTAVRAAQIMGLRVAGVDMLEGKNGPEIMEINSSPGLEGIEGATRLDIAGTIIDYAVAHVSFPEIDLRQRLTVSKGYSVLEIVMPEETRFAGKPISDLGAQAGDINVLSLSRGDGVIPNPSLDTVIEEGDHLLCFGKQSLLRSLAPEKKRRKNKPKIKELPQSPVVKAMLEELADSATDNADQNDLDLEIVQDPVVSSSVPGSSESDLFEEE